MVHVTLPPALAAERETLIAACLEQLRAEGFGGFAVQDYGQYPDPAPVVIPRLNIHLVPDIAASAPRALVACVELASDLQDVEVGRRWQALHAWASAAHTGMRLYVPNAELALARRLARHWHLDPELVRGIAKPH